MLGEDYKGFELTECAAIVHQQIHGSTDPRTPDEYEGFLRHIRRRLECWAEPTSAYDAAVKAMCEAVLAEDRARWAKKE